MKYILILLLALPIIGFSQSGTTLEEYKYCSKGYEFQIESGLDPVKKGYQTKKVYTYYSKSTIVEFVNFVKTSTNDLQAIILILKDNDAKQYYCMPNEFAKQEVWNMYYDRLGEENNKRQQEIMMAFCNYIQVVDNTEDKKTVNRPIYDYNNRKATTSKQQYGSNSKSGKGMSGKSGSRNYEIDNSKYFVGGGLTGREYIGEFPKNESGQFGKVNLNICVDKKGKVTDVQFSQRGSTTMNSTLLDLAKKSAKKFKFKNNPYAPDKQCGTITFKFRPG